MRGGAGASIGLRLRSSSKCGVMASATATSVSLGFGGIGAEPKIMIVNHGSITKDISGARVLSRCKLIIYGLCARWICRQLACNPCDESLYPEESNATQENPLRHVGRLIVRKGLGEGTDCAFR